MKNYKRLICVTISFGVLFTAITGCGSQKANSDESSPSQVSGQVSTQQTKPAKPVDLSVELYDRSNAPANGGTLQDNYLTNWIKKEVGEKLNINVTFVPIPRSSDDDKISVLMAAGTAPDICFTYTDSRFFSYAKNGGLTALDDVLNNNGANLKNFLGDNVLAYGKYNGKMYCIPAKRAVTAEHCFIMRKDWLDKLGVAAPTTTDEFYSIMKQFKEKDPAGVGKDKVIAYGMAGLRYEMYYDQLLNSFRAPLTEEEFYTLPLIAQKGTVDGLVLLSKMYNEGLISKDFAIDDTGKKLNEDIVKGYVGSFMSQPQVPFYTSGDSVMRTLAANIPTAELVAVDCFKNSEGKYRKTQYDLMGMRIMVPKSCKNPDAAVKYLDWVSQNILTLQYGTEGVHYKLEDGLPVVIDAEKTKTDLWAGFDLGIVANGTDLGNIEKNILCESKKYPPYENVVAAAFKVSMNDAYARPYLPKPVESNIKYHETLEKIREELVINCITGKPEDVQKNYDEVYKKYLSSGGQEVQDERLEIYKSSILAK